ncbi:signal peptidase II [Peptococcaceae bacterium]|nr:signal peptidase II [Peptococcaceae bacterium]MCL0078005.1 signal peptidase II [Peptococcaceae bacterium]
MLLVLAAFVTLVIDLYSKHLVLTNMQLHQSIPVVENVFHITYVYNYGAAFGIMPGKTWFFITITVAVVAGMLIFYYRKLTNQSAWVKCALGMFVGGALGNLVDRIRFGKVVDFLDFRFWPVFNFADVAIVIGAALLIFAMFRIEH